MFVKICLPTSISRFSPNRTPKPRFDAGISSYHAERCLPSMGRGHPFHVYSSNSDIKSRFWNPVWGCLMTLLVDHASPRSKLMRGTSRPLFFFFSPECVDLRKVGDACCLVVVGMCGVASFLVSSSFVYFISTR